MIGLFDCRHSVAARELNVQHVNNHDVFITHSDKACCNSSSRRSGLSRGGLSGFSIVRLPQPDADRKLQIKRTRNVAVTTKPSMKGVSRKPGPSNKPTLARRSCSAGKVAVGSCLLSTPSQASPDHLVIRYGSGTDLAYCTRTIKHGSLSKCHSHEFGVARCVSELNAIS